MNCPRRTILVFLLTAAHPLLSSCFTGKLLDEAFRKPDNEYWQATRLLDIQSGAGELLYFSFQGESTWGARGPLCGQAHLQEAFRQKDTDYFTLQPLKLGPCDVAAAPSVVTDIRSFRCDELPFPVRNTVIDFAGVPDAAGRCFGINRIRFSTGKPIFAARVSPGFSYLALLTEDEPPEIYWSHIPSKPAPAPGEDVTFFGAGSKDIPESMPPIEDWTPVPVQYYDFGAGLLFELKSVQWAKLQRPDQTAEFRQHAVFNEPTGRSKDRNQYALLPLLPLTVAADVILAPISIVVVLVSLVVFGSGTPLG